MTGGSGTARSGSRALRPAWGAAFSDRLARALPDEPGRRRRVLLIVATVAALLLALAIILPLRAGGDARAPGGPTAATPGQAANPQATVAQDPTPGPSPSATADAALPPADDSGGDDAGDDGPEIDLPDGWRVHSDRTGFSVPVPANWSVTRRGTEVYFTENGGRGRLLIIDQTRRPKADPVKDWTQQERARRGNYRDYRLIRIAPVDYWDKAADWEFRHDTARGNRLHVRKRGFITARDQAYGIHWSTLDSDWRSNLDELELIYRGFVPARQ